ncbi:MBG domain-containing protein [Brevifollis gellanilyticus]|nr:MBG domain-containing protein [Brevifollis gellanilyticus]
MLRCLAVLFACVFSTRAGTLPSVESRPLTAAEQMPAGLDKSDWSGIREAYEAGRHEFLKQKDGSYLARNPGLGWTMTFDEHGFTARPEEGTWEWGLELESGQTRPNQESFERKSGSNRLEARLGPVIMEWFVNDSRGLEQGWTLTAPAEIRLRVRGGLKSDVSAQSITFGGQITYSGLKAWDARGRIIPTHFEATAEGFAVRYDDTGAQYPLTIDPMVGSVYFNAHQMSEGDGFGSSVAVSGNTAVVGAPWEDGSSAGVNGAVNENATSAGAAYVFVRSGSAWSRQAYLKAGTLHGGDNFGWSVAISGNTVVVGALGEASSATGVNGTGSDQSAPGAGAAYVFVRNGTTWTQQAYLKASQVTAEDRFGCSVAVSGDTVVVGAYAEDGGSTGVNGTPDEALGLDGNGGAAYVFARTGTTWNQQAYLKAHQVSMHDCFGYSVAVSGDTVVVGAYGEDGGATGVNGPVDELQEGAGAVYVFTRSGTEWGQQAYLKASHVEAGDFFGDSVAISGDTVVVGVPNDDSNSTGVNSTPNWILGRDGDAGAAYVFVRNGSSWSQQAYLKARQVSAGDYFGRSVAISGDMIVIGAPGEDGGATGVNGTPDEYFGQNGNVGAAYAFVRYGAIWSQQAYLKASYLTHGDNLGVKVAASGDIALTGIPAEDNREILPYPGMVDSGRALAFSGLGATPPVITSISPVLGRTSGGTQVMIRGTGFTGLGYSKVSSVTFDGIAATEITLVDDMTISCKTPAHAAGTAQVVITTPPGGVTAPGTVYTYAMINSRPSFTLPAEGMVSAGAVWKVQPNAGRREWVSIASSADGMKLAAVAYLGQIHTSTDSGESWTAREQSRKWRSITSSADGTKLVAVAHDDRIYTSTDSGESWIGRESGRSWSCIASSADGTKLVAAEAHAAPNASGRIYTSTDSGANWIVQPNTPRNWTAMASSSDGTKLVAVTSTSNPSLSPYGWVCVSNDFGATWSPWQSQGENLWFSAASSADGTKLAALGAQLCTSADSGVNWARSLFNPSGNAIASSADGTRLVAVAKDSVYTSIDSGVTWKRWSTRRNWTAVASSADGTKLAAISDSEICTSREVCHTIKVQADRGAVTAASLVTNISAGPPSDAGQTVSFVVTNDNPALFSSQPEINGSGTLTFTPQPTACGTATVVVTAVDDGGTLHGGLDTSPPQRFTITTTTGISVTGNGMSITHADLTPSAANHTDFGTVSLTRQQVTHRFTIASAGAAPLNLTGMPSVQITGAAARDFTVTTQPDASLSHGGTAFFDINFDPTLPGVRTAMVSIPSDDPALPVFSFAISGFGRVDKLRSQTITFSPPAALHVGQGVLILNASSSSGLPVTFDLVPDQASGNYSYTQALLRGRYLLPYYRGTVKVAASQAGDGRYAPALAVVRTIIVHGTPGNTTLADLTHVYDGSPKPVSVVGLGPAVTSITYEAGGIKGPAAPVAAGSYKVEASSGGRTVTASLVIAKAPLYVTPDDQRKFAGQANPGLTYKITGFRGTDTEAVVTRMPVLRTTAGPASPGGEYAITASGAEARNYTFVYQQGTLVVDSFAGSYDALMVDGARMPVGKLAITVAASNTAFSASLTTAAESSAVSFAGSLVTNPALEQAAGSATMMKSGVPYAIQFTLPLKGRVTTSATRDGTALGSAMDGQKLSTSSVLHAGVHTVVLEPASPPEAHVPAGAGWATAAISSKGVLTLTGRLGDGTAFISSVSPDEMLDPGYRIFLQPYLDITSQTKPSGGRPALPGTPKFTPRPQCFLAGSFELISHPWLLNRRHVVAAGMIWKKSGLSTDAGYRGGFGPVNTVLLLDPWQKPVPATKTTPAVTLPQRLGLSVPDFTVTHSASGSASDAELPVRLAISSTNAVSVLSPSINLTKWKTTSFNATNGTFTGSFELTDGALKRPATFSGVLRQPADSQDALIGDGHYLLPPMTGTEKSTGEINFQRP